MTYKVPEPQSAGLQILCECMQGYALNATHAPAARVQDTVKALKQRPTTLEAFSEYTRGYQGVCARQEDIAADTTLVKARCLL